MLLVTLVLLVAYGVALAQMFSLPPLGGAIAAFPKLDSAFATLLTVSNGGYLAKTTFD